MAGGGSRAGFGGEITTGLEGLSVSVDRSWFKEFPANSRIVKVDNFDTNGEAD